MSQVKITSLFGGAFQVPGDDGLPLSGGLLYFYTVATTALADTYPTYADALAETNPNANPVVLDSAGRPDYGGSIWIRGPRKMVIKTSAGVAVGDPIDYYNSADVATAATPPTDQTNLVEDGSFENWTAGLPDACTVTPYAAATLSQDVTDQAHGESALKIVAAGSGGGVFLWDTFFSVSTLYDYLVQFLIKASDADTKNIIRVNWYDKDQVQLAGADAYTTIYSDAATNPTAWTRKFLNVTPPATARYAKPYGILSDPSGAELSGTVRIDGLHIGLTERNVVDIAATGNATIAGTATITGVLTATGGAVVGAAASDGTVTFNPSGGSSAALALRLVGIGRGTTSPGGSQCVFHSGGGIIVNSGADVAAGYMTLNLSRALTGTSYAVFVTIEGSSEATAAGFANYSIGGATLVVYTYDKTGALASKVFNIMIFEKT